MKCLQPVEVERADQVEVDHASERGEVVRAFLAECSRGDATTSSDRCSIEAAECVDRVVDNGFRSLKVEDVALVERGTDVRRVLGASGSRTVENGDLATACGNSFGGRPAHARSAADHHEAKSCDLHLVGACEVR